MPPPAQALGCKKAQEDVLAGTPDELERHGLAGDDGGPQADGDGEVVVGEGAEDGGVGGAVGEEGAQLGEEEGGEVEGAGYDEVVPVFFCVSWGSGGC